MKTFLAGLQNQVQSTYSNNGKTTALGRAMQKTINSQQVIGPSLTQFIDVQTLAGFIPTYSYYNPNTGHLFVLGPASPTPTVALFTFNNTTGAYAYVGKVILSLGNAAATTHTFRGFAVYENGTSINILVSTTGSVVINGGTYLANNLALAQFTVGGTTIYSASGASQSAMYFLQDPAGVGANFVATTSWGLSLPQYSSVSGIKTKVWQWNGTLAAPVLYSWDLANTPTVAGTVLNGVSSQTTLYANTTPSAFFTMSAQNGYLNNDIVVLQNGTGNVPTAFAAWVSGTAQVAATNVYFIRDFQQLYTFTCTALTTGISAGSTYTNNGFTFTVLTAVSSGATSFVASVVPPGAPTASGSLVRTAGTGDATITFSAAVAGQYYFNLSTTSGGALVTPTSASSSFTMMRAFGTNTSMFSLKTGTLPAFTLGTILQSNSVGACNPVSSPANIALQGVDCLYMATTTGLYMGKIADLSSLGTTWASMTFTGINNSGTGIDIVAPTNSLAAYDQMGNGFTCDRWILVTNTATYVMKPYQASNITAVFGGVTDTYYETLNPVTTQMGATALSGINIVNGWFFACSGGVGQRGIVFADVSSDATFGYSGVISPVLNIPSGSIFKYIETIEQLFDYTDSMNFWVRSASTSTDASFNSGTLPIGFPASAGVTSNGWTALKTAADLSSIGVGPYFQLCATFGILTLDANTPSQLNDFVYSCLPPAEQSDNWAVDNDNTTQGTGSPSYVSWRLQTAYASSVPTLYARVYDTSGNLIFSANTVANPTSFQYSSNDGTSWTALGTIPNTVDTRVRVLVTPTPSVVAQPSLRES